jgi:hypothetical protein
MSYHKLYNIIQKLRTANFKDFMDVRYAKKDGCGALKGGSASWTKGIPLIVWIIIIKSSVLAHWVVQYGT